MIKIIHLTATSKGGAYVAARRIADSVNKLSNNTLVNKVATIETADKSLFMTKILSIKISSFLNHVLEKLWFTFFQKDKKHRFEYSLSNYGLTINKKQIENYEIIHLHWINKGFLSIKEIGKLSKLGKPIVWTMHDMWTFTGGCHHSRVCNNYITGCGECFYLKNPSHNDLSKNIFVQKAKFWSLDRITFIAPSKWLLSNAKRSLLLKDKRVFDIPNPINTEFFSPFVNKDVLEKKSGLKNILFIAANASNPYKGYMELNNALELIHEKFFDKIELTVIGGNKKNVDFARGYKLNQIGYVSDMDVIKRHYQESSLFILPSLEENLPNTIMESLACGTPVVAFNVGGIPEMIEHKVNGYLAEKGDVEDLANGIKYVLDNPDNIDFSANARKKALECYDEKIIAAKYIDLYQTLLKNS